MISVEITKLAHTVGEGNDQAEYNGKIFQPFQFSSLPQGTRERIALFVDFFRSVPKGTEIRVLKDRVEYCATGMLECVDKDWCIDAPLTYKEIKSLGLIPIRPAVGLLRKGTIARVVGVLDCFEVFSPYLSINNGPAFSIGSLVEEDPEEGFEEPYTFQFEIVI